LTGNVTVARPPKVAFFCATYLKPEMHHIHRQILAVDDGAFVLAQKIENQSVFPGPDIEVVPRSPWRFLGRETERRFTRTPWQITRGEVVRMRDALRRRGAEVLHVFFGNVAVHMLPLLERIDQRVIVSFHGADVTGAIATPDYKQARERVFARAAVVACRSEALADAVEKMGCPRAKLRIVRTVLPEIAFRERVLPHEGDIRLVQACRLIPKKGLATTLRAFAKLAPKYPLMTLVLAGSGPLDAELRALASELGVAGRVQFTGFLDQSTLRELLASSQVFLHPSETAGGDVEGIPNGLLEAMASGLPVVATRHGGIPEAVEDGVSGMLCAERDVDGVAAAVDRLVSDPDFYAEISANGAAAARTKFSREVVGESLRRLYAEAVS
jgi:glycosyltransferase involved in cell wall biosynthesis